MATFVAQQAATFDANGVFGIFTLASLGGYLSAFSNPTLTGFTFSGDGGVVANAVGSNFHYLLGVPTSGTLTELHVTIGGNAYFDLTNASVGFDFISSGGNFSSQGSALFLALTGGDDSVTGSQFVDSLSGYDGNDSVFGRDGGDTLDGGAGNDTLDGGIGADTMRGGAGDDTYIVDNLGDVVDESIAGSSGTDTVKASVSFSLGDAVHAKGAIEKLILTGSGNIAIVGDDQANTIVGNSGDNALNGGRGNDNVDGGAGNDTLDGGIDADTMRGGAGNDTYLVDNAGDVVDELAPGSAGADTVRASLTFSLADAAHAKGAIENLILTGSANINGTGNALANFIAGNLGRNILHGGLGNDILDAGAGDDTADGGAGADTMRGGAGNDIYVVDDLRDVADELAPGSSGADTVVTAMSFDLGNPERAKGPIENLTLTGSANVNGTGNALANLIAGNLGRNILHGGGGNDILDAGAGDDTADGGAGADTMRGGAGNDTYLVDNAGDVVDEGAAGSNGIDTIEAAVSFAMADALHARGGIENLTLTGTGSFKGTGNSLSNVIVGNQGSNLLSGGLGADTLAGKAGRDAYLFDTAPSQPNLDTIVGFSLKDDTIELDNAIFTKLHKEGELKATNFELAKKADDKNDFILYDKKTGTLYYDPDGSGHQAKEAIAHLQDPIMDGLDLQRQMQHDILVV